MNKMRRPLAFLSAALLLGIAFRMMNERAVPGPPSRRDGGRSAHAVPREHERPDPRRGEPRSGQRSDLSRPPGLTGPAAYALPPSIAADRKFPAPHPDVLALELPADSFRIYQEMMAEFPHVDWTEDDPAYRALVGKRGQLPLDLEDDQREAHAAWLAAVEPVRQELVRLRAVAHGISPTGSEDGRTYNITGFRNGMPVYMQAANSNAAVTTGASFVRWNPGLDPYLGNTINGSEIYMTVSDAGEVHEHTEFQLPNGGGSRILYKQTGTLDDHATHVTGTMGAWGYNSSLQGMAPRGWLRTRINLANYHITADGMATPGQQTGQLNPRTGNPQLKSVVGNSSLGRNYQSTRYTYESAAYDTALRDYPYFMHFTAAGNSGSGYETLTGEFKTGKNMIVIGNVNSATRNAGGDLVSGGGISSSSSRGPTYDGRIKPDFVGQGTSVGSTTGATSFSYMSGTSMATPNVTGSVALLMDYVRQRLPQQYLRHPAYKALLMSTADDLGNPGPDYTYGWGLVNVHAAAKLIRQHAGSTAKRLIIEDSLSPAQTWSETYVSDGSKPIRVSIAWLDPAGYDDYDRSPRLINDLDVRIIGPGGTVYHPYVMPFTTGQGASPAFSGNLYNSNAVTGDNITDPLEQVRIATPVAGTYMVQVTHKGTLWYNQAQMFSVAVNGLSKHADLPPVQSYSFTEAIVQDGMLNPGEEAVATVTMINRFTDPYANVVAKLTTGDPDVTILSDTVNYGTLTAGQTSVGDGTFRIRLAPGASPRTVALDLTITSSADEPFVHPMTCVYVNPIAISGYVRDGLGNPLAGATVAWTGTRTGQVTSAANGFYAIPEVDGTYAVSASAPGFISSPPVSLTVPPSRTRDFALDSCDLTVTPDPLSVQAPAGQKVSRTLYLANTGNLPVTWSIPTSGYRFTTSDQPGGPAYAWNDISTTGTRVTGMGDDTNHGPFPLGFSMPFYGQNFTSIRINSNGWLSFTSASAGLSTSTTAALPSGSLAENLIAAMMRDLNLSSAGTVHYQQTDGGTFVVQFTDVPRYGSTNASRKVTFQVVLKHNGTILLYYSRVDDPEIGLVGIQNAARNSGLTIAYNQAFLKPGLAVRLQSTPPWLSMTPVSGTLTVGTSANVTVSCDPAGLESGTYLTNVIVNSNDTDAPVRAMQLSFIVGSTQTQVSAWPLASPLVYGQALSASTLSGGAAAVPGTFTFDQPAAILPAGTRSVAVTFTPADTVSYSPVQGNVTVTVAKATPAVHAWPAASAITYGQYFDASVLSGGTASVPGVFAFNDPAVLSDAQDSFTFRVSDGESNSAPATVSITLGGPQGALESQAFGPNASRPWTPADITSLAWYDAADASTITVENGAVSQWNDKSGNARHVSQGTSGRRPTVSGSTIAFDGTDDFLTRSGAFCYAAGSADFYVVAAATNANARIISENRSSADNPMYGFRISTTETRMGAYVRADDGSEMFNNTMSATNVFSRQAPNLYLWRDTGSNLSGRVAGGSATSVGYSRGGKAMTLDQFSIGATGPRPNAPSGLTFVNAGLNEIVITANLGDADRQKMEGYLAWKWNLQANLPAGHPYKEAAPAVITNNDPVANAQSVTVQPGVSKAITLTGSDPDNDPLTFGIVTQPTHGTLSGTPPNVTYTPPALPAVGAHDLTVTFTPTDAANYHSVTGTVGVTVGGGFFYQNWAGQYPDHDLSDASGDSDGDGLSNFQEFAFGLDPTSGSSANPIVMPFDKASRSFSYTRRAGSGLAYTICFSSDLREWQDLPPVEVTESVVESAEAGAETVTVTLSSLPDTGNLFLRVKAD